jgi:hypothetical protein
MSVAQQCNVIIAFLIDNWNIMDIMGNNCTDFSKKILAKDERC